MLRTVCGGLWVMYTQYHLKVNEWMKQCVHGGSATRCNHPIQPRFTFACLTSVVGTCSQLQSKLYRIVIQSLSSPPEEGHCFTPERQTIKAMVEAEIKEKPSQLELKIIKQIEVQYQKWSVLRRPVILKPSTWRVMMCHQGLLVIHGYAHIYSRYRR